MGRTDDTDYSGAIVVGTTDKVYSLDPARAYENGSWVAEGQIYPFLMSYAPGRSTVEPDAARACGFVEPTRYVCTLRPGLTFANGNPLTARSVKFSLDRVQRIDDPNGPSVLLSNLANTAVVDDLTVAFTLKVADDQTFPMVLATPASPIVDERTFPADRVLDDNAIVATKGFAGPYVITSYDKNRLVEFRANPDYHGILGTPKTEIIVTKYYVSSENLKLDLQNNAVDVGFRSLSPVDTDSLRSSKRVTVYEGPGGELRYIVFNLNTMPGRTVAQKLAVRKAIASSVDREALADGVYKGVYEPAYSSIPPALFGATDSFRSVYGARPNRQQAATFLRDAGIVTPVVLQLQYNPDHYGGSSSEEYAAIKSQLEATGLFRVNLQATEWVTYQKERVLDSYPLYQLGWFPDFPDPDNYLSPLFLPNSFLQDHFDDPQISAAISAEATEPDPGKRSAILHRIQDALAAEHIPILPLLSGKQVAVAAKDIDGLPSTLDASFRFRYTVLSRPA